MANAALDHNNLKSIGDTKIVSEVQSETGISRGLSKFERAGLIIGIIILLVQCFRLFGFTHDDAFITYRYASNLFHYKFFYVF